MRIHAGIWSVLVALLLTVTPVTASAAPGENQGMGEERRSERADAALDAARDLFGTRHASAAQHGPDARRTTANSDAEHASLVLRDLAVSLDDLDASERKVARRILARPTDGADDVWKNGYDPKAPTAYTCSDKAAICLHWVTDKTDEDAPDVADTDGDKVPEIGRAHV